MGTLAEATILDNLLYLLPLPTLPRRSSALAYAIHNQRDRRNLTDGDILRCVEALDRRKDRGGDRKSQEYEQIRGNGTPDKPFQPKSKASSEAIDRSKSAHDTASLIGTSRPKVERARTVLAHAPQEVRQAVLSGEKSINRAYQENQSDPLPTEVSTNRRDFGIGPHSHSDLLSPSHAPQEILCPGPLPARFARGGPSGVSSEGALAVFSGAGELVPLGARSSGSGRRPEGGRKLLIPRGGRRGFSPMLPNRLGNIQSQTATSAPPTPPWPAWPAPKGDRRGVRG